MFMLGRSNIAFLPITIFTFLLLVLIYTSNQQVSSQSSQTVVPPAQLESIKITNLMQSQSVDLQKELIVTGESSDNNTKDCSAYVMVNSIQPYQSAVARGPGGATDFSQWEFVLHNQYTHLNEGNNKITAKLVCSTAPTRWYSVVVSGVPSSNLSETETVSSEPTTQQKLLVTISLLKNPLARGDRQDATITVMDSNNKSIANAQIDGKLIYPGNNFEKEFKGVTDLDGKFVYSWIVGKKGDVGPLLIEVEVSSQGYPSTLLNSSFELVESGESSKILDPFQSNFQTP